MQKGVVVAAASMACLEEGQKVLDVGCGAGHSTFLLASRYGVYVQGLDLSPSLVHIAIDTHAISDPELVSKVVRLLLLS